MLSLHLGQIIFIFFLPIIHRCVTVIITRVGFEPTTFAILEQCHTPAAVDAAKCRTRC